MPANTPKLALPNPNGNDANTRANFNALVSAIDSAAAAQTQVDQPWHLDSATYDSTNNRLVLTLGVGRASFLGAMVSTAANTTVYVANPAINTTYYLYVKSDGTFFTNITGAGAAGSVIIWQVATGATVSTITATDRRGQLPEAAARVVQDNLNTHAGATTGAHPSSAIAFTPGGNSGFAGSVADVNAALGDVDSRTKTNATNITTAQNTANTANSAANSAQTAITNHTGAINGAAHALSAIAGDAVDDSGVVPTSNVAVQTQLLRINGILAQIKAVIGGTNWFTAIPASLTTLWAKFSASTGHKHTGAANDGPQLDPTAALTAGGAVQGAVPYATATGIAMLAPGTAGQVLKSGGGGANPSWTTTYADPTTTAGDMMLRNGSNVVSRLPVGASGQFLQVSGGVPGWAAAPPAGAMTLISDQLLASAVASVTFTNIPATYKHLRLLVEVSSNYANATDSLGLRFNSDAGANYAYGTVYIAGNATPTANNASAANYALVPSITASNAARPSAPTVISLDILDYASITFQKAAFGTFYANEFLAAQQAALGIVGLAWQNTAAVSSITLLLTSGQTFVIGNRFTLYGIN